MAEPATATLSPAMSPSSEPPSGTHSPTAGGTQRLLFTHDLVSGKHRGAMRFGLVRMIHGEEDFEDSDSEIDGDGGGRGGGGRGGGAPCNSDNESGAADTRSWPLGREFVRVQWYPEGTKQDIRETQVTLLNGADDLCVLFFIYSHKANHNDQQFNISLSFSVAMI